MSTADPMGPLDPWRLAGKVAVVTGAAGAIGRATALVFARAGAAVVLTDVRADDLGPVAAEVEAIAGSVPVVAAADIAERDQVVAVGAAAAERHGRIDVWANVAGLLHHGTVLDATPDQFQRLLAVNLAGALWGCQVAASHMRKGGSIINVTSGAADEPSPRVALYGMAKAGATQLTRSFAVEAGPLGIRVNAVSPGYVESAMTSARWTGPDGTVDEAARAGAIERVQARSPLGTIGTADDMAHCLLFLASDASRYVTGQVLRPNGGVVI